MPIRRPAILAILAVIIAFGSVAPTFSQAPPVVPALPDSERRTTYTPSASTGPFSVGFALYGDGSDYGNWIEVYLTTGSGVSAVTTKLAAVTDYTLSSATGTLATIPRPITDATITLSSAKTGTLQIVGSRRPRRTSQFSQGKGVAARDLNQVITDIVATQRETWDRTNDLTGRSLLTNPGETVGPLPSVAARSGGVLGFDSSGNPIPLATLTGLGNVVGPNSSTVGHIATFGNAAGTVLLDGGLIGAGNMVGPVSSTVNHAATFKDSGATSIIDSGLTLTPSTGTFTLTNGKTLAVSNSLTFTGTDSSSVAFGAGGTTAYTANNLSAFASTTSAQLAGVLSDESGTGLAVFNNGPTFIAPVLGAASATSVNKLAITAPASGSTLTVADGKTLGANNSITLAGTDGKTLTLTNGLTVNTNDGTLAFGAASKTLTVNNSLGLSGTDGKTLTVNNSGTLGGGDAWTLAIAASKTLTASNSLTFTGTDGTSFAFPSTSDTVVGAAATQTLSNKTITAPTINGGAATGLTNFGIRSSGTGAFDLTLANTENLTAGRTLTLTTNNANRTVNLSGNLTTAAAFSTAGANAITLTSTNTTNVTLPVSGTLATQDVSNTFSATNTFSALNQFTDIKLSSGLLYPTSDSTTALRIAKADGTTTFATFDSTNKRVGINKTPGAFDLDVNGAANIGGALTFGTLSSTSLGASPTTITGLTNNASPVTGSDYVPYYSSANGAINKITIASLISSATAGVSTLNGLSGALTLSNGNGIASVSAVGSTVTVSANIAANADIWGSTANKMVDAATLNTAGNPVTLTDGATVTIDPAAGVDFKLTFTTHGGTRTLANPSTSMPAGRTGCFWFVQDGTGGEGITLGTSWMTGGSSGITLSSVASATDLVCYKALDSTHIAIGVSQLNTKH